MQTVKWWNENAGHYKTFTYVTGLKMGPSKNTANRHIAIFEEEATNFIQAARDNIQEMLDGFGDVIHPVWHGSQPPAWKTKSV